VTAHSWELMIVRRVDKINPAFFVRYAGGRLEQAPALRIKKILFPRTEEVYLPPQRSLITLIWMEQAPALRIKKILFPRTEGVYLPPQLLFQTIMRLEQAPAVREDLSPSATLSINGHAARASPSRKD